MTSIYEVLELLRLNGGEMFLSELRKLGSDVFVIIKRLETVGWVRKEPVIVTSPQGKPRIRYKVKLTETAWNMLKKFNVESFYDLPFARAREQWLIEKRGRTFRRFDQI